MDWTDLPLARATVDRAAERRADPELIPRLRADPTTQVVLVRQGLVATLDDGARLDVLAPAEVDGGEPDGAASDGAASDGAASDGAASDGAASDGESWLFLGADADRGYLALVLPDPGPHPQPVPGPEVDPADLEGFLPPGGEPDGAATGRAERLNAREWSHLRTVGSAMPARDAGLGVTAVALAAWHRTHRCCPRCGTPTEVGHAGWVRHCPTDGVDQYPRTDPAVIMAVVDADDRLLLGHASHWPERRFSTLAGYVEPGEGLEQAVRREVDEEVGVVVGEVAYRGSQPWPFPASLMLAYRAQAVTTAITVDGLEVSEARWFTRDELAEAVAGQEVLLPGRASIARALIEEWFGAELAGA